MTLPGESPTSSPVVWFEIAGSDPQQLREFYSQVFGWNIQVKEGGSYAETKPLKPEGSIGGGICAPHAGLPPYLTVYVAVDDLDAALARANQLGGMTVISKTTIPGAVTFAMLRDPAGNLLGLLWNRVPD